MATDISRDGTGAGADLAGLAGLLATTGDPVALASFCDREGADEIVILDITASSEGRAMMIGIVERAAGEVFVPSPWGAA